MSEPQLNQLSQAVQGFSNHQLAWASGYLARLGAQHSPEAQKPQNQSAASFTILYASQSGNAQSVAKQLAVQARQSGLSPQLVDVAEYKPRNIAKEKHLALVVSTQGEGEIPESAFELYRYLTGSRAPKLDQLNFSVFALGDSSYEFYCKAGEDFEAAFTQLGATTLSSRVDADVDFEEPAREWTTNTVEQLKDILPNGNHQVIPFSLVANQSEAGASKTSPLFSTLLEKRRITSPEALSEVHHLVFENPEGNLQYQPGDSLGVWFKNDPELVSDILEALGIDGETSITLNSETLSIHQALIEKLELTQLHPKVLKAWATNSGNSDLIKLVEGKDKTRNYISEHQFADLITTFPVRLSAEELVEVLLPLQPRLYSIASSQAEYDDEIHLTIALNTHETSQAQRTGGASGHLLRRLKAGDTAGIYIAPNASFRLPEDNNKPLILIGAGTGVAPFRSFLQQRSSDNAAGNHWLVSGHRDFYSDFLYQVDWLALRSKQQLEKATPAFSRDSKTPCYVQDRLREHGAELHQWIQNGAYIYVCGNPRMAADVHQTLIDVIASQNNITEAQASEFIDQLRSEGRYQKDVY